MDASAHKPICGVRKRSNTCILTPIQWGFRKPQNKLQSVSYQQRHTWKYLVVTVTTPDPHGSHTSTPLSLRDEHGATKGPAKDMLRSPTASDEPFAAATDPGPAEIEMLDSAEPGWFETDTYV